MPSYSTLRASGLAVHAAANQHAFLCVRIAQTEVHLFCAAAARYAFWPRTEPCPCFLQVSPVIFNFWFAAGIVISSLVPLVKHPLVSFLAV